MSAPELTLGYTEEGNKKAVGVLQRLLPHFTRDNLVIVGGLATRYNLASHGFPVLERPFNDLDVMIKNPSEMKPSITDEFLIYHYHPPKQESFYMVLVDPQTKTKVDIFDYDPAPIQPEIVQVGDYTVSIRGAADQLTKTVFDLLRITAPHRTDPKQFSDARLLMQIADPEVARRIWEERHAHKYPFSIEEALVKADEARVEYPEKVFEHPYRRSELYVCGECEEVPGYPITPMKRIFDLLGYVD